MKVKDLEQEVRNTISEEQKEAARQQLREKIEAVEKVKQWVKAAEDRLEKLKNLAEGAEKELQEFLEKDVEEVKTKGLTLNDLQGIWDDITGSRTIVGDVCESTYYSTTPR